MNNVYTQKVEVLLKIIPIVAGEECFAIHGGTAIGFDYSEFEETRWNLIKSVNNMFTDEDKSFLISFESGKPNWEVSEYESFKNYPSVQWKQLNIQKLKKSNPAKWQEEIEKLKQVLKINE